MRLRHFALACVLLTTTTAHAQEFRSTIDPTSLAAEKKTLHQKYLTSAEAHQLITDNPDIVFVDVRDPVEFGIHGHPDKIDALVPVRAQSTEFDDEIMQWRLKDNPDFLAHMARALAHLGKTKHDMIIVTCGTGRRSALAADQLYQAGYTDVWHITDGFPGDDQPGFSLANAWQLADLPWSYDDVYGSHWLRVIE